MVTRGVVGRDRLGVWNWHVHTAIFKVDNQQGPTVRKKKKERKRGREREREGGRVEGRKKERKLTMTKKTQQKSHKKV